MAPPNSRQATELVNRHAVDLAQILADELQGYRLTHFRVVAYPMATSENPGEPHLGLYTIADFADRGWGVANSSKITPETVTARGKPLLEAIVRRMAIDMRHLLEREHGEAARDRAEVDPR